ncbi:MAG: anti-sigma factor [Pseudomonadota bacterium]
MTITGKDKDVLAGELALGVLEGQERADAMRLMLSDPEFAAKVEIWREDLSGLYDDLPQAEPSAAVWDRISADIGGVANDTGPNRSLAFWRGGALISGAVAAALMVALVFPRGDEAVSVPATAQQQSYAIAQLSSDIEGLTLAARFDPDAAQLRVRVDGMPQSDTVPVLWVVSADDAVQPLGIINRKGETVLMVESAPRALIRDGSVFSVSMEPETEEPYAQPSAEFVAQGRITTI